MKNDLKEQWKRIPQFPRYEVSNMGRVKSYTSTKHPEGKILKVSVENDGYTNVKLISGDKRSSENGMYTKKVHRLVAEAFIPVPEELQGYDLSELQVDHILPVSDGGGIINPETGEFNLRWCTPQGNANNPNTLRKYARIAEAKRKRVYQYTEDLQLVAEYVSTKEASERLGKSQGTIASCCSGALRRYLGYIFSYQPLNDIKDRERIEKEAEDQRERNHANVMMAVKRHYIKNEERIKEWQRQYYINHKEEYAARARKNYLRRKSIKLRNQTQDQ